jgi:ectoine hydroxylase
VTPVGTSPYPSRIDDRVRRIPRREPVVWGSGTGGPIDVDGLARYERDGLLVFDALLTAREVDELRVEVDRVMEAPDVLASDRTICEPSSDEVRSVFDVHRISERFARLFADERLVGVARQVLGSDVYIHQSRVNRKPGFRGRDFYWHSDFETWHVEDGMPAMRAVSVAISLTGNRADNGSLMIIPGSHRWFVGCVGQTPDEHYLESLRSQEYGVPDDDSLRDLVAAGGIVTITGTPGSAVVFDCNAMHGSNGNITPYDRCNVFVVFNSVENCLVEPQGGLAPRPTFLAARP